jgi:hypothetical protein
MIASSTLAAASPPKIGRMDRPWRQDEPIHQSSRQVGPEQPFATLDDAIAGTAYMASTGKLRDDLHEQSSGTFAIHQDGDAFRAVQLLVPVWERSLGNERIVDYAAMRSERPDVTDRGELTLTFETNRRTDWGSTSRTDAQGTMKLDASGATVAIVGSNWAFVGGKLGSVEAADPFPPPPPPPPPPPAPPIGPVIATAVDLINQSIELIETVPVTDTGDAATKDARIGAYKLNMSAQNVLEEAFLDPSRDAGIVSALRHADAQLEDANWQLAKKPSPDGRFNGVDIPGALRDSRAAIDVLEQLATSVTEPAAA